MNKEQILNYLQKYSKYNLINKNKFKYESENITWYLINIKNFDFEEKKSLAEILRMFNLYTILVLKLHILEYKFKINGFLDKKY